MATAVEALGSPAEKEGQEARPAPAAAAPAAAVAEATVAEATVVEVTVVETTIVEAAEAPEKPKPPKPRLGAVPKAAAESEREQDGQSKAAEERKPAPVGKPGAQADGDDIR
jgi:hypothetical protein